jgi:4-amino-4-deoxy-L-arabinose transferase-like glycosyltransferase
MNLSLQAAPRLPAAAAALLLAVGVVVAWATADDYGVAWDDWVQTQYGEKVLGYFLSCGRDRACNEYLDLRFYAPAFELPAAALCRAVPDRVVEVRHFLCALTTLSSIPALYQLGRVLGNRWIGMAAALLLLLSPAFYGHAFVNSKDIPFAIGFLWSMTALAAMFTKGQYRWREVLACGAAIGLTVSVRPGGWMLILPLYGLAVAVADWQSRGRVDQRPRRRTLLKQAGLLLVAWLVMVLPWPWAHENPLLNPLQAIRMASKFHLVVPVLFEGQVVSSDQLPRYYLLKYLLITTPPAVLGLAAAGLIGGGIQMAHRSNRPRSLALAILAAWLLMPLGLFAVIRPNAYDGMRHFLFIVPAVAIWAAIGLACLWQALRWPAARGALVVVLGGVLVTQTATIVWLHPYQMTYFSCVAGGLGGADGQYETDYWLTSYKEAIEWIDAQPRERSRATRVLVAANENSRWCAAYFASDGLIIETTLTGGQTGDLPVGVDYYVGTSRSAMDANFPAARVIHQIDRDGAVFTTIKRPAAGS